MTRIQEVHPLDSYRLEIQLENGSSVCLNFKQFLTQIRFSMLNNPNYFNKAATDGTFVRWGDELEVSIHEIFQLAQQ